MTSPLARAFQPPVPPLGEVLEFLRLLWSVDHGLQRASKGMERTLGVTGPQRLVLLILGRFPGISAGQVARILHVHPSTLTSLLARLERRGMLKRSPDPRDRRRALLALTAAGRKVDAAVPGTVEDTLRHLLARLPAGQVAAARSVLAALAAELELAPISSSPGSTSRAAG
jgi:DNA-binding MarR family transcriptional regulator